MMKGFKNILYITIIMVIFIGFFAYKYNNNKELKIKCTNSSYDYIFICMERGNLYPQEQYDFYYNIAISNKQIPGINNDLFYQGFNMAYNNCSIYSKPEPCQIHDKNIINDFAYICTSTANKELLCVNDYFRDNLPNKENITYFIKIVENEIKENKNSHMPLEFSCNQSLRSFYHKVEGDLIKEIPLAVKQACSINN